MADDSPGDFALFRQALQEHGHAFHYATIKAIERASTIQDSGWHFVASEVPIALNGEEVHADLIFRSHRHYLIGECKRVNPAYSQWLFAQTRFTTGGGPASVTVEELCLDSPGSAGMHVRPFQMAPARRAFQVGVTVRTKDKGQGCVSDKKAIEETVSQVSRAAGGFAELCSVNRGLVDGPARIIPAIFTTARLFTCLYDLELADLATGDLPARVEFESVPWLWFQRGLSESLLADLPGRYVAEHAPTWPQYFSRAAIRSVAIVNVDGIDSFMRELDF